MATRARAWFLPARRAGQGRSVRLRDELAGRRHVLPDFVILGAARSGVSALLQQLDTHPNVLEGPGETHFFDSQRYRSGVGWYRTQFPSQQARRRARERGLDPVLTGESSPTYLWHPNAPARLARAIPEAQLLVLLRNPVARAASHWARRVSEGREHRSFREAVEAELGPPGEASRLRVPAGRDLDDPLIVRRGVYLPQLQRWQAHIHADRLLVIQSERWFRDTPGTWAEVCAYLELPALPPQPLGLLDGPPLAEPDDPETLARLRAFYRPWNAALEDHLDVDIDWDEPSGD